MEILLLAGGALLVLAALMGLLAGRRLARGLLADPYHREGDAVAAYLPGCSLVVLAVGLLLAGLGAWLAASAG